MKIASFDVGQKNFAFCVEELDEGKEITLLNGTIQRLMVQDITTNNKYDIDSFLNFLNNQEWSDCDVFIIENQLKPNIKSLKVAFHLEAYLRIHFPAKKLILFSSRYKTKVFGFKDLSYSKRKTFTINKALEILALRKDTASLLYIKNLSKKDDVCDAICQLQAYKLIFLNK